MFEVMPVRPDGRSLDFDKLSDRNLDGMSYNSCLQLVEGAEPDCVALYGKFNLLREEEGLLFLLITRDPNQPERLEGYILGGNFTKYDRPVKLDLSGLKMEPQDVIDKVLAGEFKLVPSRKFDLSVGGERLELAR